MADYTVPVRGEAFVFFVSLVSQADTKIAQVNPTLAAGDVKVQTDDGSLANITTLPTGAASSKRVKVSLSASEMTGDNIWIQFSDAAGAEWCDLGVCIQTSARGVDDLAYPTVSGRSLDVSAGGEAGVDWANVGSPTTVVGLSGTTVKTATDVETDTADIQTRLPAALTADGNIKADTLRVGGTLQTAGDLGAGVAAILDDTGTSGVVVAAGSKTGYALAAAGLDAVTATDPGGVASTFPQMVVALWRRFFKKTTMTSTQIKTYGDDGSTVRTTQTISDDGTTQTQGAAS